MPLHAWTERFFLKGCAEFGRLAAVHEVTESRKHLDEAYIEVCTGISRMVRLLCCLINGSLFEIHIAEVEGDLKEIDQLAITISDSKQRLEKSWDEPWKDCKSVDGLLLSSPEIGGSDGHTAAGGDTTVGSNKHEASLHIPRSLGNEKLVANYHAGIYLGSEKEQFVAVEEDADFPFRPGPERLRGDGLHGGPDNFSKETGPEGPEGSLEDGLRGGPSYSPRPLLSERDKGELELGSRQVFSFGAASTLRGYY